MKRRRFLLAGFAFCCAGLALSWPLWRSFGALPKEPMSSPNWRDGAFHNLPDSYVYTGLCRETAYPSSWFKFFFSRGNRYPAVQVKSHKSNLKNLRDGEFVWLGHSSLLLRLSGKFICMDPVLSSHASPIPFIIPAWSGASPYGPEDFPLIDYLCISHDHWDHLDYSAINSLHYKKILCGKGVGAHFAAWRIDSEPIELDWFEKRRIDGVEFIFTPTQHFSGRGLTRNKSLWGGFIINAGSSGKVYFTGDGGYGHHFEQIGQAYGPFDIIFPDTGQYNRAWSKMHMFPEQSAQAALDARASLACPVHIGKFTLAWHPWDEPFKRFAACAAKMRLPCIFPEIGQIANISGNNTIRGDA